MRIMIVDDHEVIQEGLAQLMKQSFLIDSCLFAFEGRQAIELTNSHVFDLIILDLSMPQGLDGLETLCRLKKKLPGTKIVVFSMYDDISYQQKAYECGADGYINKNTRREDMVASLDKIIAGHIVFDQRVLNGNNEDSSYRSWKLPLTDREREVFILMVMGYTQKEIAEKLSITVNTVENHRYRIAEKLETNKKCDWIEIAKKYNVFEVY